MEDQLIVCLLAFLCYRFLLWQGRLHSQGSITDGPIPPLHPGNSHWRGGHPTLPLQDRLCSQEDTLNDDSGLVPGHYQGPNFNQVPGKRIERNAGSMQRDPGNGMTLLERGYKDPYERYASNVQLPRRIEQRG